MNKIDLIIDALELFHDTPMVENEKNVLLKALAAARKLKSLKPLAYYSKKHDIVITAYELGRHIDGDDVPLYALDKVTK